MFINKDSFLINNSGEWVKYTEQIENNINSGFRFLTCDNYIIFYQITKETILIVRILHRLQDYVKQLF